MIVLLSPHYVVSKVCQEEYNLSSALHSDFAYSTKLIPLLVKTTQVLPAWCRNYTPIDCREMSDRDLKNFIRKIDVFKGECHVIGYVTKIGSSLLPCLFISEISEIVDSFHEMYHINVSLFYEYKGPVIIYSWGWD